MLQLKGQSSLEFLVILGIGFTLVLVMGSIFFTYSNDAKVSLDSKQLKNIGDDIINNVEKVYFLGIGNKITIKTSFPNGIENITIHNIKVGSQDVSYYNISYIGDKQVLSEIFEPVESYVKLNCSSGPEGCIRHNANVSYYPNDMFTGGYKKIRIESRGDYVNIDFMRE